MNTAGKLAAFAAVVAVGFGAAAAVGSAVGPIDVGSDSATHDTHGGADQVEAADSTRVSRSLRAATGSRSTATVVPAGEPAPFGFAIVDDDGETVTAFDELHERPLHLIVLSRNMVDYLHLHPTLDPTGHWTVDVAGARSGLVPGVRRLPTGRRCEPDTRHRHHRPGRRSPMSRLPNASNVVDRRRIHGHDDRHAGVGRQRAELHRRTDGQVVRTDPYLGRGRPPGRDPRRRPRLPARASERRREHAGR